MNKSTIKKAIRDEIKELKDEDIFTSTAYNDYLTSLAQGMSSRYGVKRISVKVFNGGVPFVACTDNNIIMLNLRNDFIEKAESRLEKHMIYVGIIMHECGHLLFTDFALSEKATAMYRKGIIFPSIEEKLVKKLSDAIKDETVYRRTTNIFHRFDNMIEDGHIEKRILKAIPGMKNTLESVRKAHKEEFAEHIATADTKLSKYAILSNLVLGYAKYGEIYADETVDAEVMDSLNEMIPFMDEAVDCNSAFDRKKAINTAYITFLLMLLKTILEDEEEKNSSENSSENSDDSNDSGDSSDESREDSDNSSSEASDNKTNSEKSTKSQEEEKEDSYKENDESGLSDDKSSESLKDSKEGKGSNPDEESASKECEDEKSDEEKIKDALDKISKALDETLNKIKNEEDGKEHKNSKPMAGNEAEAEEKEKECDLESSLDDVMTKIASEIISDKNGHIEKEMKKIAEKTDKARREYPHNDARGSIVKVLDKKIGMPDYLKYHQEDDRIARRVIKSTDKVIRERIKGSKETGVYIGTHLEASQAYRQDRKIMSNKILPTKTPDMEVVVCVDCSGSMGCGYRMYYANKTAYITYRFCTELGIPCTVYGQTTDRNCHEHPMMICAADNENMIDGNTDGSRIYGLYPQANNRDGFAIEFCAQKLMLSKAKSKLLLIISDGEPAAQNYYGSAWVYEDVRFAVEKAKKNKISVITAGIDDCANEIADVYLDKNRKEKYLAKFLDCSDMDRLPKAFAQIIKKELL